MFVRPTNRRAGNERSVLPVNCHRCCRLGSVNGMADSPLQQQLDEIRGLLNRARDLFGANPVEPPLGISPDPRAAHKWVH